MATSMYRLIPGFISRSDTEHLLKLALGRKLWLHNNPNGDVGAWLPEREDFVDFVLEHAIIHSRLEMGERPVADGDVIFLKYPEGGGIGPHKDKHLHGRHLRCGILLQRPQMGGVLFIGNEEVLMEPGDAVIYRADEAEHWVTTAIQGERYLLTVGTVF